MNTRMGQFAESMDLQGRSETGYDQDFLDAITMTRRRPIAQQATAEINRSRQNAFNSGMEFSGAQSVKVPAMIKAEMAGRQLEVDNQVHTMNEQYKNQSLQSWLGVLAHEDTMALEQRKMELAEGDILDQIGRFSALVGSFIP